MLRVFGLKEEMALNALAMLTLETFAVILLLVR